MQIIWLYGPPAVGKSTTAWQLYVDLSATGISCAYVDIDQLGMCYPAQWQDPDRHRLKGLALAAIVPNYADAGAGTLIVSGVLDPNLIPWYHEVLNGNDLVFCRLSIDEDELRRRHDASKASPDTWQKSLEAMHALDAAHLTHLRIEAEGQTPQEVADSLRIKLGLTSGTRTVATPLVSSRNADETIHRQPSGEVIWLTGTSAVGTSTAAWATFSLLRTRGITAGYLDLQQLGFAGNAIRYPDHVLQSANVASLWECFGAAGATHLVMSGAAETDEQVHLYREALFSAHLTLFCLQASREALEERVRSRGRGEGPQLAGDRLIDQPAAILERETCRSWADQLRLDSRCIGDVVIDTNGLTPQTISEQLTSESTRSMQNQR